VVYIGRVLEAAYFQKLPETQDPKKIKEVPLLMLAPMWALVLANIYFGIDTSLTTEAASAASELLFQNTTLSTSQLAINPLSSDPFTSKALGVAP